MSDKNKNKKSLLRDFLKYRSDELTGEERNSFERELQKDPFAEEAAEGFSRISAEDAEKDLSALQKRLDKRQSRRSPVVFYRIAAAVAVLTVISSIFIVTQRKNQVVTLSENISNEKKAPVSRPVSEPLQAPLEKSSDKKQVIPPPSPQKSITGIRTANNKIEEMQAKDQQQMTLTDSEITKPDLYVVTSNEVESKSVLADKRMDMARAAGAPTAAKSEKVRDYIPSQPVVGRDSFDIYLEKNIRNPEPDEYEEHVVIVNFKVNPDSTVSGIKIISSPGKDYSREAIRLIKDGPAWKPAEENGKLIEDEVRIRIVFK